MKQYYWIVFSIENVSNAFSSDFSEFCLFIAQRKNLIEKYQDMNTLKFGTFDGCGNDLEDVYMMFKDIEMQTDSYMSYDNEIQSHYDATNTKLITITSLEFEVFVDWENIVVSNIALAYDGMRGIKTYIDKYMDLQRSNYNCIKSMFDLLSFYLCNDSDKLNTDDYYVIRQCMSDINELLPFGDDDKEVGETDEQILFRNLLIHKSSFK